MVKNRLTLTLKLVPANDNQVRDLDHKSGHKRNPVDARIISLAKLLATTVVTEAMDQITTPANDNAPETDKG